MSDMQTSAKHQYPFTCFRCEKEPKERFSVFEPTDDWIIAYPDLQLIHVHFGVSSQSPEENIGMSKLVVQWWDNLTKQYPGRRFFFINDLTRKDDGEVIEDESKKDMAYVRKHPQSGGGAIYGQTVAMSMLLNLLNHFTQRELTARYTLQECEEDYEEWFAKEKAEQTV
jgi:hypothetical protein